MKKKDITLLHKKSITELEKQAEDLSKELVNLRLKIKSDKEKNVCLFKIKRHDLARLKTILSEKRLEAAQSVPEVKGEK